MEDQQSVGALSKHKYSLLSFIRKLLLGVNVRVTVCWDRLQQTHNPDLDG